MDMELISVDMELIDAVQEHVDAAYDPDADIHDDPIDWTHAEKTAHEHLDKFVGYDAVQKAIAHFKK